MAAYVNLLSLQLLTHGRRSDEQPEVDAPDHGQDRWTIRSAGHPGRRPYGRPITRQTALLAPRALQKDRRGEPLDTRPTVRHITRLRSRFCRHRNPIVSVDAKKRELLGNFKNAGRKWQRIPTPLTAVLCSSSSVTRPPPLPSLLPLVAPGGCRRYPNAKHLPILADTGGSNSATHGGWKDQLQQRLCDRLGLTVTVAHYPTGASKYNPIDAACSVKSARTGPPSLSPATARSSV